MRQDILATITNIIRDCLDDPTISLTESMAFVDISGWDSLILVTLMATLENTYNIQLNIKDMQTAHTVGELITLLEKTS